MNRYANIFIFFSEILKLTNSIIIFKKTLVQFYNFYLFIFYKREVCFELWGPPNRQIPSKKRMRAHGIL